MCSFRELSRRFINAASPAPVGGLSLQESSDGAEIAFVAQEISLLLSLGPEADCVGECIHGLAVASDE